MLNFPQVALAFMNSDHAEFVALCKHLLDLLDRGADVGQIDRQLDDLLQHTRSHFAEEEQQMLSVHFPPYPVHKGEHDKVLQDMAHRIDRWKDTRDAATLRDWLELGVREWFVNHVSSMDFVTAAFISSRSGR